MVVALAAAITEAVAKVVRPAILAVVMAICLVSKVEILRHMLSF